MKTIAWIISILMLLIVAGCVITAGGFGLIKDGTIATGLFGSTRLNPVGEPNVTAVASGPITSTSLIREDIARSSWLLTVFLLGAVGGVFAGLNGIKAGWIATLSCIAGIFLRSALCITTTYWVAGILLCGAFVLVGISIFVRSRALEEIVIGIQRFKKDARLNGAKLATGEGIAEHLNNILAISQSSETKKVVNNIKNGNGGKI